MHDTIGGLADPHLDTPADAHRAGQHLVNIRVQSFDPGETIAAFFYRNRAFGVITQSQAGNSEIGRFLLDSPESVSTNRAEVTVLMNSI